MEQWSEHTEYWRKGTLKKEEEPQNSSQPERPRRKSWATSKPTGSLNPSLCPVPKLQTSHYDQGTRFCCSGTSSTCTTALLSPQLPQGLGFSCLLFPQQAVLPEPSMHPGPHKPPQSEPLLRAGWPRGSGLRQPSLHPWGKREAALSAQTQKASSHISPSTRNTWFNSTNPIYVLSSPQPGTPHSREADERHETRYLPPADAAAGAGARCSLFPPGPTASAPQDGLPAPRLVHKTSPHLSHHLIPHISGYTVTYVAVLWYQGYFYITNLRVCWGQDKLLLCNEQ